MNIVTPKLLVWECNCVTPDAPVRHLENSSTRVVAFSEYQKQSMKLMQLMIDYAQLNNTLYEVQDMLNETEAIERLGNAEQATLHARISSVLKGYKAEKDEQHE